MLLADLDSAGGSHYECHTMECKHYVHSIFYLWAFCLLFLLRFKYGTELWVGNHYITFGVILLYR
jgi:hypothetical protein